MQSSPAQIFRTEALLKYMGRSNKPVFPKLISPRSFTIIWVLILLIFAAGALTWLARVPVYAPALVVVVEGKVLQKWNPDRPAMIVFIAPDRLSELQVGQRVFFKSSINGEIASSTIISIEPDLISPKTAQENFGLSNGAASKINEAKAVALARFETVSGDASSYTGSYYDAWVETGSHRLISYLPVFERYVKR